MKKRYSSQWKKLVIGAAVSVAVIPGHASSVWATTISGPTSSQTMVDGAGSLTITSSGSITATSGATTTGVYVSSELSGSISNNGTITVSNPATTSASAHLYGISVDGNLSGSITNSGDISVHATASSQASAYGINVNGELSGSISNSGTIIAGAQSSNGQASAYGITTNGYDLSGSIENIAPGSIIVTAHSTNSQATAYGITTGNLTGGAYITNSGTISAEATSTSNNAQASAISTGALDGDNAHITNSGTISAEADAYSQATAYGISTGDLTGLGAYIENSDTLTAAATANATSSGNATAYGIITGSLSGDNAHITNSGTISAEADAYSQATAYGISTGDLFGVGAYIDNSGTITATAHSTNSQANAYGISTGALSGDGAHIINSSSIDAEATVTQNDQGAFASGIYTGELGGAGTGAYIENSLGGTITATANATGGPSLHATAYGIYAGGDLTGNGAHIINSGTIEATANAASQATAYGIQAGSLSGNGAYLTNSGTITVQARSVNNNASAYGISTGDMVAGTSLTNGGAITVTANAASQAHAYGIYVNNLDAAATIANSGTITATASGATPEAYAIYVGGGSGTITNTGTLNGKVELASSTLNLEGTAGRITGAVTGGAGSAVNVNGAFTAENTFTVEAFNVGAAGALSVPAASGVPVTIHGNYTQAPGGVFQTYVSGPSNYGKLVVDGTANLPATTNIYVNVAGGAPLANGNVLRSVFSANTLNVGTLSVDDNSAMWIFTGTVNGNAIDLTTEQALTFVEAVSNIAVSPAAMGVAGALDAIQEAGATGDMQTVLNELGTLATEAEVAAAVTQLMPGFTGGSANIVQGLASSGGSRVVHAHMAGAGQGLSSGEPLFKDRMVWAQPFYSATNQSERKGVAGYNADSYGLALGADGKVDEQWRVGAALSLAKGDVDGDSPVTRENLDINTYQLTLYATDALTEATSMNLQAGFGINDNDSSRNIQFGGLNRTATGDFTSWHTLLDAELEHRYTMSEKAALAPYLRAQYSYVKVEDYTETGAGAINLRMDDNSEDSLILSVGGKAAYALTDQVKLTGHLGAGYDFMASQSSVTATFSGGGPAFVTEGLDPSPFLMQGGVGFEMLNANGLTITARYDVDGREDYNNQTATVNFRMPF